MTRIFGFDIGTTSIGFAVVDHNKEKLSGNILRMGVRIFPEARDPKGTPLNQQRRQKRMMRRQLRRRRERRRALNEALAEAGLLPSFSKEKDSVWSKLMAEDPYALRVRGLDEALTAHELGRALYHLAKRRHFKGREIEDDNAAGATANNKQADESEAEEQEAKNQSESTHRTLQVDKKTLGQWLGCRGSHVRKRGEHALRQDVEDEFEKLWEAQAKHHAVLRLAEFKASAKDIIFAQRPVFWRKNTLGQCCFMPAEPLCPKGSWLSQQRRMLEQLNNLAVAGGNTRPLEDEERAAILAKLQAQASMSWAGVRTALKPLYKQRGEPGLEKSIKFNLEYGGEKGLLGNALEAKLLSIFGKGWEGHSHKQEIRDAIHERLWAADYGEIGSQRVVIRSAEDRRKAREAAATSFIDDFGVSAEEAEQLRQLKLPTGWEPYSTKALRAFLPHLEARVRFGALVNGPKWEEWRDRIFPDREKPTGEIFDRLPSPTKEFPDEMKRIARLRNPTVVRTQNELRKVVNNLIGMFGKPDLIRVEIARDVGKSKREREEIQSGIAKNERRRKEAYNDLQSKGFTDPSRDDVEKWLLWQESGERCPYTGDHISFAALFGEGRFDVEHIWPRWRSFDDSFRNKTLCRKDLNIKKSNTTPFEAFGHEPSWDEMKDRIWSFVKEGKMRPSKAKRFCREEDLPEDFASRQLNDTGYAARQAISQLKRLWPDEGGAAPVRVEVVTGRVTAQLRKLWSLNNILSDDGEKTRADHRHHAIDALVVACTHPGITNRLSRYWQEKDNPLATRPSLEQPWASIRPDAEKAVNEIIVSHRVRKKVSGPLHKETVYGDTREDVTTKSGTYRRFVTRKNLESLTKGELEDIRDDQVRKIVKDWVAENGGDPKKAFARYPRLDGSEIEIRKARLTVKQQMSLMARIGTGHADLGSNHHVAIYKCPDGKTHAEIVSLFEASRRLSRQEPVVVRSREDGAEFVMSLAAGEAVRLEEGEKKGVWIVQGVWANGQIVLCDGNDANGGTTWRPTAASLVASSGRKVSIDPIGRLRPAHD